VRSVVTVLVTGTFGVAAAAEPAAKPRPAAPSAAQPPALAPAVAKAPPHGLHAKPAAKAPTPPPKKVDINNASLEQLKSGLQLGDAEAKRIIEHRPYKSRGELMTKAGLPEGVYQAVKRKVELQKPRKAATK
jgi:competence protein ComEA